MSGSQSSFPLTSAIRRAITEKLGQRVGKSNADLVIFMTENTGLQLGEELDMTGRLPTRILGAQIFYEGHMLTGEFEVRWR